MRTYEYFIDLDERGEFLADVRDPEGNTIFEIEVTEEDNIFEDGFMSHTKDIQGLEKYLKSTGFMPKNSVLVFGE